MKGHIFDIQHFCTHDGPGIRTTVFFKGCPLRCQWCHNPESQNNNTDIMFYQNSCIECDSCIHVCPTNYSTNPLKNALRPKECLSCLKCINECPTQALKKIGYYSDTDQIVKEIVKDQIYYTNTGGGITLSGGEPLFQPLFCKQLLIETKSHGINTAIETSGYASTETIQSVIPHVDYLIWDIKAPSDKLYKEYTGQLFHPIQKNLFTAIPLAKKIKLRFMLISGIHNSEENKDTYRDFIKLLPKGIEKEVIPYHNFGNSKMKPLGLKDQHLFAEPTKQEVIEFEKLLY